MIKQISQFQLYYKIKIFNLLQFYYFLPNFILKRSSMIELRQKRATFHQSIRKSQRKTYRVQARKKIAASQKRQEIIRNLHEAFWPLFSFQESKEKFWEEQFLANQNYYKGPYETISFICQKILTIIGKIQNDEETTSTVNEWLLQNHGYLIPPPSININQFPINFINLSLYLIFDHSLPQQLKESYFRCLEFSTVKRCLLSYFCSNWQEIKQNKCQDNSVRLFMQIIKHSNIFQKSQFNDVRFQYLFKIVLEDLFAVTEQERKIYQSFQAFSFDSLRREETSEKQQLSNRFYMLSGEDRLEYLMRNFSFLCHILLMSPVPNYNMKENAHKLTTLLNYFYRNVYLNTLSKYLAFQNTQTIVFIMAVLIKSTVNPQSNHYLSIISSILQNLIQRDKSKSKHLQIQVTISPKQNQPNLEKVKPIIQSNQLPISFINKIVLIMLSRASEQLETLKFQHIQKWLTYQLQTTNQSILSLQNPHLVSYLLQLLTNILKNQKSQKFSSYSLEKRFQNFKAQNTLMTKIKLCKLIGKSGFNQLFNHSNLKYYCLDLAQMMTILIQNLQNFNEISCFISSLMFNHDTLDDFYVKNCDSFEDDKMEYHYDNSMLLKSFKSHIYSLCLKFLQKSFKYLSYKSKEKIMLNLVLGDYLSVEQSCQFLTFEESQKFMNDFSLNNYNQFLEQQIQQERSESDESDIMQEQTFDEVQNTQDRKKKNYEYGKLQEVKNSSLKFSQQNISYYDYIRPDIQI